MVRKKPLQLFSDELINSNRPFRCQTELCKSQYDKVGDFTQFKINIRSSQK
jgi:hypothetical protein